MKSMLILGAVGAVVVAAHSNAFAAGMCARTVNVRTTRLERCSFANVPHPANGRTWCSPDCRHLDADDGSRPLGARQAGLVRGWITASYDIIPKSKHQ